MPGSDGLLPRATEGAGHWRPVHWSVSTREVLGWLSGGGKDGVQSTEISSKTRVSSLRVPLRGYIVVDRAGSVCGHYFTARSRHAGGVRLGWVVPSLCVLRVSEAGGVHVLRCV